MKNMPNKNISPNGIHFLIGFFGCDAKQINSPVFWRKILTTSLKKSKMSILHSHYYKFNPHGITGFLLLSSSHLSIHTWPEFGYVACDVFSCSTESDTQSVIDFLVNNIKHRKVEVKKIKRGYRYS